MVVVILASDDAEIYTEGELSSSSLIPPLRFVILGGWTMIYASRDDAAVPADNCFQQGTRKTASITALDPGSSLKLVAYDAFKVCMFPRVFSSCFAQHDCGWVWCDAGAGHGHGQVHGDHAVRLPQLQHPYLSLLRLHVLWSRW